MAVDFIKEGDQPKDYYYSGKADYLDNNRNKW